MIMEREKRKEKKKKPILSFSKENDDIRGTFIFAWLFCFALSVKAKRPIILR